MNENESYEVRTDSVDKVDKKIDNPLIQVGGKEYSLATLALFLMLIGVLLPSVIYSIKLKDPTPAQLLVAICIALFSSVIFLWILDATSILRFRAEWVSKTIYGAAIASILGTSVAVYQDAFSERKYPYEGRWEMTIQDPNDTQGYLARNSLVLSYSESAGTYWGYSDFQSSNDTDLTRTFWLKVVDFDPKKPRIELLLYLKSGGKMPLNASLVVERQGRLFRCKPNSRFLLNLSRPK